MSDQSGPAAQDDSRDRPDRLSLRHSKLEAKRRLAAGEFITLHDAQLVLARCYGFESWPKLKAYVDGVTVRRLAAAVRAGDLAQARGMLESRPELANMAMSYGEIVLATVPAAPVR